ncbi:hypothetical protein [Nakamurella sp.]|uniref:hypothetical protein n=1 Tax=Nakamurella sp. TaxID=1869182 RepID=UPI003782FAA3
MAKRAFWTMLAGGVTATALAATVALAGPAAAAPVAGQAVSATAAQATDTPKYCARIDKALDRRQKAQDRWNGDANTRGSIAWLQAKAQSLSSSNPELSKLMTDMANLRAQVKDPAAGIISDLQAVKQAHCS